VWLHSIWIVNGFIDHLYTRLGSTSTYNAIAGLHILQITRARAKFSQSAFTSRFLVTVLNNEDFSASVVTPLPAGWYSIESQTQSKIQVRFTLRLAVYRQSFRHGVKPLETHDQRFFQMHPCGNNPYVISCLTRRWVCLVWICLASRKVCVSHITACYWKFFLLHYMKIM
jgi:hypothetical protein